MNASFWLAPRGLLSLLSYSTPAHQPTGGITHCGLDPLTPITNQENSPQACPQANRVGNIFSIEVPSSPVTLACVN